MARALRHRSLEDHLLFAAPMALPTALAQLGGKRKSGSRRSS